MFCINCGTTINEGELICKGCGKLSSSMRDELLALSEKTTDLKCTKCGEPLHSEHHFCNNCGAPAYADLM